MIEVLEEGNVLNVKFPKHLPNLLDIQLQTELLYMDDAVAFGRLMLLMGGEVILARHVVAEIDPDEPPASA